RAPEVGQHLLVRPAGIAEGGPAVEALALAAHVQQAVDRARSAEHAPAGLLDAPAAEPGLRLGLEFPVDARVEHRLAVPERNVDPRVRVPGTRLEEQDAVAAARRQAVREHAARAAR